MKTIKIFSLLILSMIMFTSCVNDEVDTDANVESPNLLGFVNSKLNSTITADGSTATYTIPMSIKGPTASEISNDITASIVIDPSSTAVEGTHFTLDTNSVVFSPTNNHITSMDFTVLSAGISAPSEETLVLSIVNSSDASVFPSGRTGKVIITIKYLCFSDLSGTYTNTDLPSGAADQATVTETGAGSYTVSGLPYLGWGGATPITFNIIEDCGNVNIVGSELMDAGYLTVGSGIVNEDGSFTLNYIVYNGTTDDTGIFFDFSSPGDTSTYTPL